MSGSVPNTKPAQADKLIEGVAMDTKHKFTKGDEQLPYTVMALLDVCSMATDDLSDQANREHTLRYASSVGVAIRHAYDLLVEFHEKLEMTGRLEVQE